MKWLKGKTQGIPLSATERKHLGPHYTGVGTGFIFGVTGLTETLHLPLLPTQEGVCSSRNSRPGNSEGSSEKGVSGSHEQAGY